jgi:xanthine dehydrogenase accessory factor
MAPFVVALGPGFPAGVIATAWCGRPSGAIISGTILREGTAAANTGIPGIIAGHGRDRVLRSPCAGVFTSDHRIGDMVGAGEIVAMVAPPDGRMEMVQPVLATNDGVLAWLCSMTE